MEVHHSISLVLLCVYDCVGLLPSAADSHSYDATAHVQTCDWAVCARLLLTVYTCTLTDLALLSWSTNSFL